MWPFRRRTNDEHIDSPTPVAAGDTLSRPEPAPRPSPEAWRTLPPIQRTVGPAPHTYRTDDIGEIMSSWDSPRLSGELGHQVSASAPAGVLHDMATVVDTGPPAHLQPSPDTHTFREIHHDRHGEAAPAATFAAPTADPAAPPSSTSAPDVPTVARLPLTDSPARPASATPSAPPSAPAAVAGATGVAGTTGTAGAANTATPAEPGESGEPGSTRGEPGDGLVAPVAAASLPIVARRSLPTVTDTVPATSQITAPEMVTPRPLSALPLQRTTDSPAPGRAAVLPIQIPSGSTSPATSPLGESGSTSTTAPTLGAAGPTGDTASIEIPFPSAPPTSSARRAAGPSLPPGAELGPPIQPRAVQRRALDMPLPPGPVAPTTTGSAAEPSPLSSGATLAAPHGALTPTAGGSETADAGAAAGAHSPATSPQETTTAPITGAAAPLVQRTTAAADSVEGLAPRADAETPGPSPAPAMPLTLPTADAGPATDVGAAASTDVDSAAPATSPTSSEPPAGADPTPAVRPIGLGEPLLRPTTPTVDTTPTAPADGPSSRPGAPLPLAASLPAATVQRSSDSAAPSAGSTVTGSTSLSAAADSASPAPTTDGQGAAGPPLAALLGDRAFEPSTDPTAAPGAAETAVSTGEPSNLTLPFVSPVPPPSSVTVGTLGDSPLVLQRSLDEGPPTLLGEPAPVATSVAPASTAASAPGTLRAAAAGSGAVAQRTPLSPTAMPGRPPAQVLPAMASRGPANPSMTLAAPPRPEVVSPSWSNAGDIAVANGVAQRMPDGSVSFTVQREPPSPGPMAATPAGGAEPAQQPGGIVGRAGPAPEAAPTPGNERDQLEDQARKLWPHLRRKITNEMLSGPTGRQSNW